VRRFDYIEAQMAEGGGDIAQLGREYAELRPVVGEIRAYRKLLEEIEATEAMLDDPEMRDLAREELTELQQRRPEMEAELKRALLPATPPMRAPRS
jgi:bacterial peptide chain release factor 1 (bRF-1)